jgi:hypothetical protein
MANEIVYARRILVIEDEPGPLAALVGYLMEFLSWCFDISIDTADSRSSARDHLGKMRQSGQYYLAVVSDYQLPENRGGTPNLNPAFTRELLRQLPLESLIVFTAFSGQAELKKVWETFNGVYPIIDKGDADHALQIARLLRSRCIEVLIRRPIRSSAFRQTIGVESSPLVRGGSDSEFSMAVLRAAILKAWSVLDEATRELVKNSFLVVFDDNQTTPLALKEPSQPWWLERNRSWREEA